MNKFTDFVAKTDRESKWVFIGEVEMNNEEAYKGADGRNICPDGNRHKHFLFKRNCENGCMYSIVSTRRKRNAELCNPVYMEGDPSIFAILTSLISSSLCNFRGTPLENNFKERKIRLVGMSNWIEPNLEYRAYKISDSELETLFESDRIDLDEFRNKIKDV